MAAKQARPSLELNHRHAKWADGGVLPSKMIWIHQMNPLKKIMMAKKSLTEMSARKESFLKIHTSNENGGD